MLENMVEFLALLFSYVKILQHVGKLLLQEWIHINHVIRDRLKKSIEQLKGKILESITPEERFIKIHVRNLLI